MKKVIGVIKKVYLPDEKIGGEQVADLYKSNIGFEVEIGGKIVKFEEKQNKTNVKIYCGDKVALFFDLTKSKLPIKIEAIHE